MFKNRFKQFSRASLHLQWLSVLLQDRVLGVKFLHLFKLLLSQFVNFQKDFRNVLLLDRCSLWQGWGKTKSIQMGSRKIKRNNENESLFSIFIVPFKIL